LLLSVLPHVLDRAERTQSVSISSERRGVSKLVANREFDDGQEQGTTDDALARDVIGAAIEVHRILGPGLLESVYEEAMCVELALAGIFFERQVGVKLRYKKRGIGSAKLDLLVGRRLVVELKTVEDIAPVHVAQLLSYLKFTGLNLGLLVNFNVPALRHGIKRVVRPVPPPSPDSQTHQCSIDLAKPPSGSRPAS
jgi:GxxExxY protein